MTHYSDEEVEAIEEIGPHITNINKLLPEIQQSIETVENQFVKGELIDNAVKACQTAETINNHLSEAARLSTILTGQV